MPRRGGRRRSGVFSSSFNTVEQIERQPSAADRARSVGGFALGFLKSLTPLDELIGSIFDDAPGVSAPVPTPGGIAGQLGGPAGEAAFGGLQEEEGLGEEVDRRTRGTPGQRAQEIAEDVSDRGALIDYVENTFGPLSPEAQATLDRLKVVQAKNLQLVQRGIDEQLRTLQLAEVVRSKQLDPSKEVVLDELISLADAEQLKPGLTEDFLNELLENIDDPKARKVLLDTESDRQGAIIAIEDFVFQKQQIQAFLVTAEEDIQRADTEARLGKSTFQFDIVRDPSELGQSTFIDVFESRFPALEKKLSEEELVAFIGGINRLAFPTDPDGNALPRLPEEEIGFAIENLAISAGINEFKLQQAFDNAVETADATTEEIVGALDEDKLVPGSMGMAFAVFQVATDVFKDPEFANALANSNLMHKILSLSNGDTGFKGGGSLVGVGSLSREVYSELGIPYDSIQDSMEAQLTALMRYIEAGWGGDVRAAYLALLNNSEWGTLRLLRTNEEVRNFSPRPVQLGLPTT